MMPARGLAADPKAAVAPVRAAYLYFPNGAWMDAWVPKQTGADYELPFSLTPLAPVTGRGKLYSFTVIPADASAGSEAFILGLVQLCEGPMLTARLEPSPGRPPQIGDPVRITRNEPGGVVFASSASVVAATESRAASLLEVQ